MKYDCSDELKKEIKKFVRTYDINYLLADVLGVMLTASSALFISLFFNRYYRSYCIVRFLLIGVLLVLCKLVYMLKNSVIEKIDEKSKELKRVLADTEWFETRIVRKQVLNIVIMVLVCIFTFGFIYYPVAYNTYRKNVWCAVNYDGPYYIETSDYDLSEYDKKVLSREEALNIYETYNIKRNGEKVDIDKALNDLSNKYAVVVYCDTENYYIRTVSSVKENGNTVSIIVIKGGGEAASYFVGTSYHICFIPVSDEVNSVEYEYRYYY